MQFKVGDRVEVLTPADGAQPPPKPGPGTITAVSQFEGEYRVKLDSDQTSPDYYYSKDQLRPVPSIPTPSITVGTQVRLTGVVYDIGIQSLEGYAQVNLDGGEDSPWIRLEDLEVIRQPFKRGEVVYSKVAATNEVPTFVVLNDESLGFIDVTNCETGFYIPNDNAEAYERRP